MKYPEDRRIVLSQIIFFPQDFYFPNRKLKKADLEDANYGCPWPS